MIRVALGAALLLLMSTLSLGQSEPGTAGQEENIRGVTGVRLRVMLGHYPHRMEERQKPEILKLVEADAAAKLEKAGIPFYVSPSDPRRNSSYAVLVITLTMTEETVLKHIDNEVKLLQSVRLSHDPSIEFEAVTWLTGGSVGGPKQWDLDGNTRKQVSDLVDGFIKDYFSVNPKESAASPASKVIRP